MSCGYGGVAAAAGAVVVVVVVDGGIVAVVGACEVGNAPAAMMSYCGGVLDAAVGSPFRLLLCGVARPNASIACTRRDGGVSHSSEEPEI